MTRFVVFCSLALVLSTIPGGIAGPACAQKHHRNKNCVKLCKAKWGWLGNMMGTDRWGSVMSKVKGSSEVWDAIIAQACGLPDSETALPAATESSASAVPTFYGQPSQSAQPTSTLLSSSSVATSSPIASDTASVLPTSSVVTRSTSISSVKLPTTTRIITSVRPTPVPTTTRAPTTQAPPATTRPATTNPPANPGSGNGGDIQAYLTSHNTVRANHGAAPLVWSNELAGKAQQWANGCDFRHSGGSLGPYGENLAAGTGSSYDIAEAVKSWTDEVSEFRSSSPQPSHFTQVVWKGTQQLGCAVQMCDGIFPNQSGKAKYFVCEYFPAGNVIGEFAGNVQA